MLSFKRVMLQILCVHTNLREHCIPRMLLQCIPAIARQAHLPQHCRLPQYVRKSTLGHLPQAIAAILRQGKNIARWSRTCAFAFQRFKLRFLHTGLLNGRLHLPNECTTQHDARRAQGVEKKKKKKRRQGRIDEERKHEFEIRTAACTHN